EPVRRQSSDLGTSVLAPDFSFRSTFPQRDTTPLPLTFELFEARERLEREDFNCDFSRVLNEARMESTQVDPETDEETQPPEEPEPEQRPGGNAKPEVREQDRPSPLAPIELQMASYVSQ